MHADVGIMKATQMFAILALGAHSSVRSVQDDAARAGGPAMRSTQTAVPDCTRRTPLQELMGCNNTALPSNLKAKDASLLAFTLTSGVKGKMRQGGAG